MGLQQCFESADPCYYFRDPPGPDANGDVFAVGPRFGATSRWFPQGPLGATFNAFLLAFPRARSEELRSLTVTSLRPGCVWSSSKNEVTPVNDPAHDPPFVNVYAIMRNVYYDEAHTQDAAWWVFDAADGNFQQRERVTRVGTFRDQYAAVPTVGDYTPETSCIVADPRGSDSGAALWRWGAFEDANDNGPTSFAADSFAQTANVPANRVHFSDYGITHQETADFGISAFEDRVFIRGKRENDGSPWDVGRVAMYSIRTKTKVADLWVPNASVGIVPTGDGRVWVADSYGWLVCYKTYDGARVCAFRNPRPFLHGGFAYGWDRAYGRLLLLEATDSTADGSSTVRVRGFFPVPNARYLTAAIPLKPPRKNQETRYFANLCEDGGVGVSSRLMEIQLGSLPGAPTDADGDAEFQLFPTAVGSLTIPLFVPGSTRVSVTSDGARLPASTIRVWSTTEFTSAGSFKVQALGSSGLGEDDQTITYTSKDGTAFYGCAGGVGTLFAGGLVRQ